MKRADYDFAVIGAGPAGLAVAIGARLAGLTVVVAEKRRGPIDKACGEGIMPAGIAELRRLGVLDKIDPARKAPIRGIRYVNEDGSSATGKLPNGGGLGIRRLALSEAFFSRAKEVGVVLSEGSAAEWITSSDEAHEIRVGDGSITAKFLVGADGASSKIRERAGLGKTQGSGGRFGARRHYAIAPWSDSVEIYFAPGIEAYVTPVGAKEVGVAFLWDKNRTGPLNFEESLDKFPVLAKHVAGAEPTSKVQGLGPLQRACSTVIARNVALVGDAAGYVDAITGEGISLALSTAAALVENLPEQRTGYLENYARVHGKKFREYVYLTNALLWIARHPSLRRRVIRTMSRRPVLFEEILRRVLSPPGAQK